MDNLNLTHICDEVLRKLSNGESSSFRDLMGVGDKFDLPRKRLFASAVKQLKDDNLIMGESHGYMITPDGQRFIVDGGYNGLFEKEKMQEMFTQQLHASTLSTNASVQKTNESILEINTETKKSFISQKQLGWTSFSVAVAAVIVAAIPIFKDDGSAQMKTLIEQQNQKFDSMVKVQQQIERHLSRITTDTLHLPVQLPVGRNNNLGKASR